MKPFRFWLDAINPMMKEEDFQKKWWTEEKRVA